MTPALALDLRLRGYTAEDLGVLFRLALQSAKLFLCDPARQPLPWDGPWVRGPGCARRWWANDMSTAQNAAPSAASVRSSPLRSTEFSILTHTLQAPPRVLPAEIEIRSRYRRKSDSGTPEDNYRSSIPAPLIWTGIRSSGLEDQHLPWQEPAAAALAALAGVVEQNRARQR